MDLLYVRSLFRPADLGGNRYPWEVTRRLAQRGHRIRVITPRILGPLPGPTEAEICSYPVSRRTPLETFATNAFFSRVAIERELRHGRPAVIVVSSYEVAFGLFAFPGPARSVSAVYIYHGRFLSDAVERLRRARGPRGIAGAMLVRFTNTVERLALATPRAVVAVSTFSKDEIERRVGTGRHVEVIPTGVDVDLFRPGDRVASRRVLGLADDDKVLVAVGRLAPVKRYDLAIDVLARLRRTDERYRLLIVGDGPERARLEKHAANVGVADAVSFEGFRDGDELLLRLWAADLQLCTSEFENWSLALLEALAAGLPVVGVPRGGIVPMLSAVDRRLLTAGDAVDDIALVVTRLMDDSSTRAEISARASSLVRSQFGWDGVVDRLEELFERCALDHAAPR